MKYCRHCGNEVFDDAIICPKCGCSVDYSNRNVNPINNPSENVSPMSLVGFILSFFSAIAGLIVSIIAYKDAKRIGSRRSMSFSKAGIILSSISLGLSVFVGVIAVIVEVLWGIGSIVY